jgi:diguanylate cyclase (GGDEF)-like protein
VSYQISLNLVSVPLAVVGLLSLLVWGLSLSLDLRRGEDRMLLWVYRLLVLINAALMGLYFVGINGWLETVTGARLVLAVVVFLTPTMIAFVKRLHHERSDWQERSLWGISAVMALAIAFDRGAFISGQTTVGPGWSLPTPGVLLIPFFVLSLLGMLIAFREIARHSSTAPGHGELQVSGAILTVFGSLDFIGVIVRTGLPPMLWLGSLVVVLAFSRAILREYRAAFHSLEVVERERDDLSQRLTVDELTGLFTRTHGSVVLERALAGGGACVVFIDIDDFKSWNDRHSHAVGDRVLREVARVVRASARSEDAAARYAGDEFFVVLPGARLEAGLRVAEAIRRNLAAITVEDQAITASLGVARGDANDLAASVLDRADRAAYQAKRDGKNRVSRAVVTV